MAKLTSQATEAAGDLRATIGESAKDISERAREVAINAADSTIGFAKKYPVHTALGALGVGCLLGYMARKPK